MEIWLKTGIAQVPKLSRYTGATQIRGLGRQGKTSYHGIKWWYQDMKWSFHAMKRPFQAALRLRKLLSYAMITVFLM